MMLRTLKYLLVFHYVCGGLGTWGFSANGGTGQGRRRRATGARGTALSMVFEVPLEKVTEQISTQDVLDRILDETLRTSARRPVMIQFDLNGSSMWQHWRGTVFAETWRSTVQNALWAALVYALFFRKPELRQTLAGFHIIWAQILGVTTFTLTFFVNQSYSIWCRILRSCRDLQGGLNNFLMAAAGYAQRRENVETAWSSSHITSEYTTASRNVLLVEARYVRLFTILLYAALTRSHRPLLTPLGLRRMVFRGILTERERVVLKEADVPANARHNVVLMWMFHIMVQGSKDKLFDGGPGWEQQLVRQVQDIRGLANGIEAVLRGRMPFAYAHIVQVLVDTMLWLYPFMVYSSGINLFLGLFGTLILTSCYRGLFDLAKQFLDPFHNENFWTGDDALVVDTLIAETNSNSVRWMNCLVNVPMTTRAIQNGDLNDFILPDNGFTVEEAMKMEVEQELKKTVQAAGRATAQTTGSQSAQTTEEEEEATESELEETVAILNAQPGLDFVPGLDDEGESLLYHKSYGNNSTDTIESDYADGSFDDALAAQFWEAADEELKEMKDLADAEETESVLE